ncbi:lipoprotein signal peptidase LspA [Gottschalkia acidurici 9a]|uniref:Lipoprotein signal peptidase n=1 Tax=Gottschalkia acidurici (strain ATCC 7906 / DSM 604 / BCRC 14475 / CIP 104303 / KCTC 5404 / NCIMB 10678 / 9a) TaxID=1128398 RepID=K0AY37_GOTA9|nr:signal peptidase II [Gottschalkia acidurici]AFS78703.1 lipoprotein signal peptidase LspA [Gottschalkia acidurici 9a]
MLATLLVLGTILVDQISKYFAVMYLENQEPFVIIDNFLKLNYVRNPGAAWGILQNQRTFFIILTSLVIIGILVYIKSNKNLTKLTRYSLFMIIGGAIGNLIDRIRLAYVVDFIDVTFGKLYDFPVFNFADTFIVIGTFLMIYLIMTNKYEIEVEKE